MEYSYPLSINQEVINSVNCVNLQSIEIDNKLSFEKHIFTPGKNVSNQLNAISRIQRFMSFKGKKMTNSFVYSGFNYCPLVWYGEMGQI